MYLNPEIEMEHLEAVGINLRHFISLVNLAVLFYSAFKHSYEYIK